MSWLPLSLRKLTLQHEISQDNFDLIVFSKNLRKVHNNLSHDKVKFEGVKTDEMDTAKADYEKLRDERPSQDDKTKYNAWKDKYNDAKDKWEDKKLEIENYYDKIFTEIEEDAKNEETHIQEMQTDTETQRDSKNSEMNSISDQIKSGIESNAIKMAG